jgi:hypothetical protein
MYYLFHQGGGNCLLCNKQMGWHSFVVWLRVFTRRIWSEESPTEDGADANWSFLTTHFAVLKCLEKAWIVSPYQIVPFGRRGRAALVNLASVDDLQGYWTKATGCKGM